MQKAEQTKQDAELESNREDNINKRDVDRQSREADRTRKLKADAVAEKEANSARFAKGKGGLIRSVLKSSNRPERTKEQAEIEVVRQQNLERMRLTRDNREAKHILECK